MANSEKSRQSEGSVYVATIASSDDSAFDPVADIIEDFMPRVSSYKDGPDECVLENVCPSEHLIHLDDFCCDKWRSRDWKPNPACPKESDQSRLLPSNVQGGVLVDLNSQGTGMDLRIDFDADLESGRKINGSCSNSSLLGSARMLIVKAWCRFMKGDFTQWFDGCSFGGTNTAGLAFYQKLNKLFLTKPAERPIVSQPVVQMTEDRIAKTASIGSEGTGMLRTDNGKVNLKSSCKKPPRPPRPPRAASHPKRERLMKGYSDMAMSRTAKLERMRSLMKNKVPKSSSSSSSVWALMFTLCFCVILIMQGLYSQGAGGARVSSVAAVETSPVAVDNYGKSARTGDRLQQAMIHQTFVSSSSHSGLGRDKARPIPSHPKAWRL